MFPKINIRYLTACFVVLVFGIFCFSGCKVANAGTNPNPVYDAEIAEMFQSKHAPNELVIKFKDPSEFPDKINEYNNEIEKIKQLTKDTIDEYTFVISVPDLSVNLVAAVLRYKNNEFIEYVEPNYTGGFSFVPNDTYYTNSNKTYLTWVNAQAAWDITRESSARIALIDSGVTEHTDLPVSVASYAAIETLSPQTDTVGHGTHMAGIMAAFGNNGKGVTGINMNANLMAAKCDTALGGITTINVVKCINWAVDNGAKVINLSMGFSSSSIRLKDALDSAYDSGCVIVAASGNSESQGVDYPARYDNVLAVGGTIDGTSRASFSNYGTGLDVIASGRYYTTDGSTGYASSLGTSGAAAMVSGLASLIFNVCPYATNEQVYEVVRQSCKDLGSSGWDEETGYGLIDMEAALLMAQELEFIPPPTPVKSISINTGDHTFPSIAGDYENTRSLTVTVTNTGNVPSGPLSVTLSGANASAFSIVNNNVTNVYPDASQTFKVQTNLGLGSGSYTATVTISGEADLTPCSFTVSFTVTAPKLIPETPQITQTYLYFPGMRVSDIGLPDGWNWVRPNDILNAGQQTAQAVYPEDTEFHQTSRNISFTVTKAPVTNTAGSATIEYTGNAFTLTSFESLFTVDPNAGTRTYSLETAGTTGTGSITSGVLAVTAPGVFKIGLVTSATTNYEASEKVIGTLTVIQSVGTTIQTDSLDAVSITCIGFTLTANIQDTNGQGIEYGINTVNTVPVSFQSSPVFTGLDADTTYYVFARTIGDDLYAAGPLQSSSVKTANHTWGEWVVKIPASCTETGSRTHTCTTCNETKSEIIPKNGEHTWGNWITVTQPSCTEAGLNIRICKLCAKSQREVIQEIGHTWSEWYITEPATYDAEGVETRECIVCGETETRAIPILVKRTPVSPDIESIIYLDGMTLADIQLPDGWVWESPDAPLDVGENTFKIIYTEDDNFKYTEEEITFTVRKEQWLHIFIFCGVAAGLCTILCLTLFGVHLRRIKVKSKSSNMPPIVTPDYTRQ